MSRIIVEAPQPEDENETATQQSDYERRLAAAAENPRSSASRAEQPPANPADSAEDAPDIPEKYRGKSIQDLIEMHRNAESELGRKGQELGTLRSLTDQLLDLKRTEDLGRNNAAPERKPITSDALFEDPEGTIAGAVAAAIEPIAQHLTSQEQREALRDFSSRHPTFQEDMQDPQFLEFVQSSPYRTRLAARLAESEKEGRYDFDAAEELWSGWEERRPAQTTQDEETAAADTAAAAADATLVTGGGAEADASAQKTIFKRHVLAKMRLEDPEGYYDPQFQAELMQAYREKRVR